MAARRRRRKKPAPSFWEGLNVAKITAIVVLLGLLGTGYLGFDSWKNAYHAAFALAGDVKQQVDGLKLLYKQSQDLQIQTQINGLNTEKRVVIRQVNDLRLKAKMVPAKDREVFEHVIKDLESEIKRIDGDIDALRGVQKAK
jgi:hypothetical protein